MKITPFCKTLLVGFIASFVWTQIARADDAAALQSGDLVGICGDSITEQKIYSVDLADYLLMCQPQPKVTAIQFGWSGEWAAGFAARMANDEAPFKPTVATICYGMNDGAYKATTPQTLDGYRTNMTAVVENLKKSGTRFIVVGGPGAVDTTAFKGCGPTIYNQTLADLSNVAKEVAAKEGVTYTNLHGMMMDAMAKAKAANGADYLVCGGDGVHPGPNGHIVMAYAFLKGLGVDGNIATITVDMKAGNADATPGTKVVSYKDGVLDLESTRYPFCFYGNNLKDSGSTKGILPFVPFNQDLNRYMLVVKNPSAQSLKVTWGTQSKTFSAADLAKGVNLANEFLDNPFSGPFHAVQDRIAGLQNLETELSKNLMHSLLDWGNVVPGAKDILESAGPQLSAKAVAKWQGERDGVIATIVPVKHEIKIEPGA